MLLRSWSRFVPFRIYLCHRTTTRQYAKYVGVVATDHDYVPFQTELQRIMTDKQRNKWEAQHIMKSKHLPQRFFVYGTLRDDDNSGALWTSTFTEGVSAAFDAKVYGFKMYRSKRHKFPFAVRTHNPRDFMVGRVLQWKDRHIFHEKVLIADKIEDYDSTRMNEGDNEFLRDVVDVQIDQSNDDDDTSSSNSTTTSRAIIYYRTMPSFGLFHCDEIPNGDWMDRHLLDPKTFTKLKSSLSMRRVP